VKGKPLPSIYMQKIREVNWAEGANTDTNIAAALNKLRSIEIKDSKIIIIPTEARTPQ